MDPHVEMNEVLWNLLASVIEPKSALYVAGPLDTGKLFYETLANGDKSASLIREENQRRLGEMVSRLRREHSSVVIDPGLLRVPGWDTRMLGNFFISVIERFVNEAWFIEGWEYSHGATKEFLYCIGGGVRCCDERGQTLGTPRAVELLANAVSHIKALGLDAEKLEQRLQAFKLQSTSPG